jgi:hypothetical protein
VEFVSILNVAQVNIRAVIDQQRVQNTLYFRSTEPGLAVLPLGALAASMESWWETNARPILPPEYSYREVYVVDQTSATAPTATSSAASGWVGTRTFGGPMPNNASIAVSFRSLLRGRAYRGRNYWPLLNKNDVAGNLVSQPFVNLITLLYDLLLPFGGATPSGWEWVVVSRTLNKLPRAQGIATPVTDVLITDRTVDSQRRRLPGRGF